MDFFRNLYEKIIEDLTQFNVEYDLNYTCNVFLSKNLTLIEIDRGWEGIPESLVINLILCSVSLILLLLGRRDSRLFYFLNHQLNFEILFSSFFCIFKFLILPFVIFRYLARYRSNVKSSSRTK